ncbi:MAG: AbrB/MazE/SpoVT family DNA-binding domain-containing protein, partial [Thermoplasmata archaeon]
RCRMATYVSKVTSAGQVTIPKRVREALGLDDEDIVEFTRVGTAVLIRKLRARRDRVAAIRAKIRRSGMTRERTEQIVEETRQEMRGRRR